MRYPVDPHECCPHTVDDLSTIQGGTREYPDGLHAFFGVEDDIGLSVTVESRDRAGLAAALRRAADEIEGRSPLDLPAVLAIPTT